MLGALLLVASVNINRSHRAKQSALPLVAVAYSIVAVVVIFQFNDFVESSLRSIIELIPFVQVSSGRAWLLIGENTLLIAVFVILKLVLKPVFSSVFSEKREFGRNLVVRVYEFSPEYNVWFVAKGFGNLRDYWRSFYWVSIAFTLLLIATALSFSDWSGFSSIAFPALAVMVIGEFYFSIDGLTKQEYKRDIVGEADSSKRIASYGALRSVLRETFPDRVLSDDVQLSSTASLSAGFQVGVLSNSTNEVERLAGGFFDQLRQSGQDVDVNLVQGTVDLMQRRSLLINNPFYRDLTPYLSLPAYYVLLQSKKCLIVVGRDSLTSDLQGWIEQGLEGITGVPNLWDIEVLRPQGRDGLHVGILRYSDVHNLELMENNEAFFKQVDYVILVEPSRMLATGQLGLSLLLGRCTKNGNPTFVAFDGNNDGLVDSLSHLIKVSLTEVVASALPQGSSCEVVWQAEGPHMTGEILPSVSRYLGVGTEIAAVGWRYQVKRVHWVGGDSFPVVDMKWIAEQYYASINSFAGLDLSQDALKEVFEVTANPWGLPQEENYFLIVEDELANVFETIRRFSSRATSVGFINLISENYLLRDYMVDNRVLFSTDAKAIPSIVPDFARTERNVVLRIIMSMVANDLTLAELEHEFELAEWTIPQVATIPAGIAADWEAPIVGRLRLAIAEHTGVINVPIKRGVRYDGSRADGNATEEYFQIESGSSLDEVISALRPAYFYVEDELSDVNVIGSLLYDHVFQALLPGQFVTYGGKYYEVQSVSPQGTRKGVVLRRAAEHIRDRRIYRQLRTYALTDIVAADSLGSTVKFGAVEIHRIIATVEIDTEGYLELNERSDLETARKVVISGIPTRQYLKKAVLEVRLPGVDPHIRQTLTLLMNELFITTYPYAHEYLCALTKDDPGDFGLLLNGLKVNEGDDSIFIVEDSMIDMGLVVSVERNWERFLETITDYLEWNETPWPEQPKQEKVNDFELILPELPDHPAKLGWFKRLVRKVNGIFAKPVPATQSQPAVAEHEIVPDPEPTIELVDPIADLDEVQQVPDSDLSSEEISEDGIHDESK